MSSNPKENLHLTIKLPVKPEIIYNAWINSTTHRDFTGGNAAIEPRNGGNFSAWDGYITGILLKLEPYHRIIQSWRTTDFHPLDPSSTLEIILDEEEGGTLLTLNHTDIPFGQSEQYKKGWEEYYFEPMLGYFTYLASENKPE
jgi:activator of HSP90 ATPase